jgi:hypothetical protein
MKNVFTIIFAATLILLFSGCRIFRGEPIRKTKKPVIYVYCPDESKEINLWLNYSGTLTTTYPKIDGNNWQITSNSQGILTNLKNGKEYSYLYYEGIPKKQDIDFNESFSIRSDTVESFLENSLTEMGFNTREKTDFISYWLPELTADDYVLIKFLYNDECNKYSTLNISPKPDSEFRLMLEFKSIPGPVTTSSPVIPSFQRSAYSVIEWGGINYTESKTGM